MISKFLFSIGFIGLLYQVGDIGYEYLQIKKKDTEITEKILKTKKRIAVLKKKLKKKKITKKEESFFIEYKKELNKLSKIGYEVESIYLKDKTEKENRVYYKANMDIKVKNRYIFKKFLSILLITKKIEKLESFDVIKEDFIKTKYKYNVMLDLRLKKEK